MYRRRVELVKDSNVWPDLPTACEPDRESGQHAESYLSTEVFQQLINGLFEQAALVDSDWTIIAVNDAWTEHVARYGFKDFMPGANYYEAVAKAAEAGNAPARTVLTALDEIKQKKRTSFRLVYEGAGLQEGKQFEARLAVMSIGDRSYLKIARYDITELTQLRHLRAGFNESLQKTKEEERRRMGRELHDSGLQTLACLSLSLGQLKRARSGEARKKAMAEMEQLLVEATREFRAISFLAHPPQLERLPLVDALCLLVQGFGHRAGLTTTFDTEGLIEPLSQVAEHTLYRVVQEAISNVHRHARASNLEVRVVRRPMMMHILVMDDGRGIPQGIRYGVGLLGMQARMSELGGRLTILRRPPGTVIVASIPIADHPEPAAAVGIPE